MPLLPSLLIEAVPSGLTAKVSLLVRLKVVCPSEGGDPNRTGGTKPAEYDETESLTLAVIAGATYW